MNKITEIKGLDNLSNLQRLDLSINQISVVKNLDNLNNLRLLNLRSNRITSMQGLKYLTHLEHLNLNRNPIKSLKGINVLTNLEELYLDDTKVTSIVDEIDKLPNLKYVSIDKRHGYIPFEEIDYLIKEKNIDVLPFKYPPYSNKRMIN